MKQSSSTCRTPSASDQQTVWTWVRVAIAFVFCPLFGLAALVLHLLVRRSRSRAVATSYNAADGNGENASSDRQKKMFEAANALIFIGIVVGALCIAAAGVAFGLIAYSGRSEWVHRVKAYRAL